MNDADTDYVYISGGTWMREATLTAGSDEINGAFAQLSDDDWTGHIFIHDTTVYLLYSQPRRPTSRGVTGTTVRRVS